MTPKNAIRRAGLAAALTALCACGEESYVPVKSNVILIVIDTLRADGILDPEGLVDTPNIDALAEDGVSFEQAFSHAPMTLPAHTSLFSSREPVATGVLNNGQGVDPHLPLLSAWLKDSGYTTRAVISLATLKDRSTLVGLSRGFDTYDRDFGRVATADQVTERIQRAFEGLHDDQPFFFFAHLSDPHEPYNSHGAEQNRAEVLMDGTEIADVMTSDMEVWEHDLTFGPGEHVIDIQSDVGFRPRLFQVHSNELEVEWTVSERLESTRHAQLKVTNPTDAAITDRTEIWVSDSTNLEEKRKRYAREIEFADRYIGIILDDLKARGLYDNSLIVFTSDHGEDFGQFHHVGHVFYLYDPYLHVPLIVKLPAGDPRVGQLQDRRKHLARLIDLAPTILEVIGVPALPGQLGVSLLHENSAPLLAQTHKPQAPANRICLRDERFKMIYTSDDETFEMFDLQADPEESHNVYDEMADERPEWSARLVALSKATEGGGLDSSNLSESEKEELDALGYAAGDEPENAPKE